jgi:hypothetical protein
MLDGPPDPHQNHVVTRAASLAAVLTFTLTTAVAFVSPDLRRPSAPSSSARHVAIASQTSPAHDSMHQRVPDRRDETIVNAAVSVDHVRLDHPSTLTALHGPHSSALPDIDPHTLPLERPTDRPHRRTLVLLI